MSANEPTADCNLPELLARDLEVSSAVFASRSMTAGCPSRGLASSDVDDDQVFQGVDVPRRPTPTYQPDSTRVAAQSIIITSEQSTLVEMSYEQDESRYQADLSDSASDTSLDMEDSVVRTREQSFTTAATSVSGRRSSLLSQKPLSPSSTGSPKLKRSHHGTWLDADTEPEAGEETGEDGNHAYTNDQPSVEGRAPQHPLAAPALKAFSSDMLPLSPSGGLRPSTATTCDRSARQAAGERPHTSSSHLRMERPRLVDIQPPVAVPKRRSSLKKTLCRPSSVSGPVDAPAMPPHSPGRSLEEERRYAAGGPLTSHPPILMLATPCGRTIIDASKPPSFDSTRREPPPRRSSIASPPHASISEGCLFDDIEDEDTVGCLEPSKHNRKPSTGTFSSWAGSTIEPLDHRWSNHGPGISGSVIPLPPNLVETLRISVSCFPDTMLLTSSLSIDTIRSYSKKLRRQPVSLDRLSEDNRSGFSLSSGSTKQPTRWGLPRLIHTRPSRQSMSLTPAPERAAATSKEPVMPNWTPIKNIFPSGADYLCDALYAHLIAFNYIICLCPPVPVQPPAPTPNDGDGQKIPKKAASILGLQETATPSCSSLNSESNVLLRRISNQRLGSDSRSRSNSESAALRDVQVGLGRCINNLIATLKSTMQNPAAGKGSVFAQSRDSEAADPLLLRALCEVVRCSEDGIN
ncbi:hypothetical protein OQA88_6229 [Cercophora sp. LCS_1]